VSTEGGRDDISALGQVHWHGLDEETLVSAADALVHRSDLEVTRRPAGDWIFDPVVSTLGHIGTAAALPVAQAHTTLDCLHRLGRSVPRATNVAAMVERALRSRDAT